MGTGAREESGPGLQVRCRAGSYNGHSIQIIVFLDLVSYGFLI